MSVGEWVSIGSLAIAFLGLAFSIFKRNKEQAIKEAEREQKQSDQHQQVMEELKNANRRLDEHNGYAEKFAETAVAITALSKDIEWIKEKLK